MTKILHVSDTHLGRFQYRSAKRREDFADAFDAAIDIAIEENVDAVIHTGDLFDDPTVPGTDLGTFDRCLDTVRRLDEANIPLHSIVGNHERKRNTQWVDIINRFDDATRLGTAGTVVTDQTGDNPVTLYGFDAVRKPEWDAKEFSLDPCPDDHTSIVCMHELFEPLVPPNRGNPYDMADFLDRLEEDSDFLPDGLALGDFHSTTSTTVNGVHAFYPGATERCKVDESSDPCVYVIEAEDGEFDLRTRTIASAGRENTPRDWIVVSVNFSEGHGVGHVEERIREESGGTIDVSEKVVVVRMNGEDVPVTTKDVHNLLDDLGAGVAHVDDRRVADVELDLDVDEDASVEDIDKMVDDAIGELSLSQLTTEAEGVVRDDNLSLDAIRGDMNKRIRDSQEDEFGEATIEQR